MPRQIGLGNHMQPVNLRRVTRDRIMMHRQVVDEHRDAGGIFGDQPRDRLTLAAGVAHDPVTDTEAGQLLAARVAAMVAQIGEDDDVGNLRDGRQCVGRVRNQRLTIHLIRKEPAKQRPHLLARHRGTAIAPGHAVREIARAEIEVDRMRLVQPHAEVADHVQQHLVAIADEQRPHIASRSACARTSACGVVSIAAAQAIRSGS